MVYTLGIENFGNAIVFEDAKALGQSPGVGKNGEQIILSLKEKMNVYLQKNQLSVNKQSIGLADSSSDNVDSTVYQEVVLAFESLGYKERDFLPVIKKHLGDSSYTSRANHKLGLKEL